MKLTMKIIEDLILIMSVIERYIAGFQLPKLRVIELL
jgi:hypothetical protein